MQPVWIRRSRIVQSLAYGCLLGCLSVIPSIVVQMIGASSQTESAAQDFAAIGGVPAAVAGALTWLIIVLLRGHTAPTGSGVFACWCGTVIGTYVLIPIWIGVVAAWGDCSFSDGSSLDRCWEKFRSMTVLTAFISLWGFIFTVPVVLPFLFLGAWLWVRRLHPRIAGTPVAQPAPGT
ncbi:MAG: hypothetical protein JO055_02965 [Alphaproteobacteria bacterium]|nr:hypothetical protein [Alphaproteobacteria bacterium]